MEKLQNADALLQIRYRKELVWQEEGHPPSPP